MFNHSHLPSNVACDGVCDCGTKRARAQYLAGNGEEDRRTVPFVIGNHARQKERRSENLAVFKT